MNFKNLLADDDAVSPVIGVILMVAITVILAAVIGTMVLGLTDNVQENVQAGASTNFDSTQDSLSVTYTSNQNADYLNATFTDDTGDSTSFHLDRPGAKVSFANNGGNDDGSNNGYVNETVSGGASWVAGTIHNGTGASTPGDSFHFVDGEDDEISVVITAHKGEDSTVILSKDGTV